MLASDHSFATAGGKGYFHAYDPVHGQELWVTDGTTAGTKLTREIIPGRGDDNAPTRTEKVVAAGNTIFFVGNDPQFGIELFKTDGTAPGTVPVMDFKEGMRDIFTPNSSQPSILAVDEKLVYFATVATTNDFGQNGRPLGLELWKTDGTTAGTLRLKEGVVDSADGVVVGLTGGGVLNHVLYYNGYTKATGGELWRSDGTRAGTFLLKDLDPRTEQDRPDLGRGSEPDGFVVAGNLLYFAANGPAGRELWRTDGTAAGTFQVHDFTPGPHPSNPLLTFSSLPNPELREAALGDQLLIQVDRATGDETFPTKSSLFITDGTDAGTRLLHPELTISEGPFVANGKAWFIAFGTFPDDPTESRSGLWFADTNKVEFVQLTYGPLSTVGDLVYYTVPNQDGTTSLVALDAKDNSTRGVLTWDAGKAGPITGFERFENSLFFSFNDGVHGQEPWVSDGTPAGTRMLKDINTATENSLNISTTTENLIVDTGASFYFRTHQYLFNEVDVKLWLSDGTDAGTAQVENAIYPDIGFDGKWGAYYKGALYHLDAELVGGRVFNGEIYRATGTNTMLFKDVYPSSPADPLANPGSWPDSFFKAGLYLYFKVRNPAFDIFTVTPGDEWMELWRTDGTDAGTIKLKSLAPGANFLSGPARFFDLNGTLLFVSIYSGLSRADLWRSDGTDGGTVKIYDAPEGIGDMRQVGNQVFFQHKGELWVTDGTSGGTHSLGGFQLSSTTASSEDPANMVAFKGALYFAGTRGLESGIYRTDGTVAGTTLAIPGIQGVGGMAATENQLYFTTSQNGPEPWNPNRNVTAAIFSVDELWRSDGTQTGTVQFYNQTFERTEAYGIHSLVNLKGTVFFLKTDRVHGTELWRTDGTRQGTTLVQDINPGSDSGFEGVTLSAANISSDSFVFPGRTGGEGLEPWILDLNTRGIPAPVLSVANTNVAGATGAPLSLPITLVSGGPVTFVAHELPPGVTIDSKTGLISGTPTFHGTYKTVVDAMNDGATRSLGLIITIADVPAVRLGYTYAEGTGLRLRVEGAAGASYKLQTSTDLRVWNELGGALQAGGEAIIPAADLKEKKRFYRVRTE